MSPEQARGKPVDKRTDIWAFGAVLYEMLTGRKAFEGETVSDTLAAVLTRDPDWSALARRDAGVRLAASASAASTAIRRRRLHDIADARLELDEPPPRRLPLSPSAPARPARRAPAFSRRVAILAAGLAALLTWRLLSRPAAAGRRPP